MPRPLHLLLLQVYRRLPRRVRRLVLGWMTPSFTVGTFCVIRHEGRVLLVRQSYRERWGFPGGLVKRGEEPRTGASREVHEEVGLSVEPIGEPTVLIASRSRRVDVVFACRLDPGVDPDSATPTSPEIREARWFAEGELPELQHEAGAGLAALEAREARGG